MDSEMCPTHREHETNPSYQPRDRSAYRLLLEHDGSIPIITVINH
jgi:hypothetical protein